MRSADKNSLHEISTSTQKDNIFKKKLLAEDQFTHKFQKNNPIIELREASFGDCELTTPNTVSWTNNEGLSH